MPTITMPTSTLRSYLKGKPSDEELAKAISMLGTDLESIGEDVSVEIFPNRPDLLSAVGLARALNHFLGYTKGMDTYTVEKGDGVVKVLPSAAKVRPHTRCAIVRGLSLDDEHIKEIIDLQEKLHVTFGRKRKKVAIGIYPLEHITLPITFGAEKPKDIVFRPLESDKDMDASTMLKEHPTGQHYAHLLEGASVYPVFRDAEGKVLSVPPIINSHDVGKVTEKTKDVFIECSGHQELPLEQALAMICCAFSDMGATVESMTVEYPDWHIITPDLTQRKLDIDIDYVVERSGIPASELSASLAKMGLSLEKDAVRIPPYRTDFMHAADVVEDAAIGYGYDRIEPRVPSIYTVGKLARTTIIEDAIRGVLSGMGMQEFMDYYLRADGVPLENQLTQDFAALREELLAGMLDTLKKNVNNRYPQQAFEVGPVFAKGKSDTGVVESRHAAAVRCAEDADYTQARQALEALCRAMDWWVTFEEHEDERFLPGRCARVTGDIHGVVGEIHPKELSARSIHMPTCAFEISSMLTKAEKVINRL